MKPSQIEGGIKTVIKVGAIVAAIAHFTLPKIKSIVKESIVKRHRHFH